jgi:hypothetical protein
MNSQASPNLAQPLFIPYSIASFDLSEEKKIQGSVRLGQMQIFFPEEVIGEKGEKEVQYCGVTCAHIFRDKDESVIDKLAYVVVDSDKKASISIPPVYLRIGKVIMEDRAHDLCKVLVDKHFPLGADLRVPSEDPTKLNVDIRVSSEK